MNPKQLLYEVEEVLRTMPPDATRRHPELDKKVWLGRAAYIIQQWNPSRSAEFGQLLKQFHAPMAREAGQAFQQIIVLLNQAQYDLHAQTRRLALQAYHEHLKAQDDVIRNSPSPEIPLTASIPLFTLFGEINRTFPELNLPAFEGHGNPSALRTQLTFAMQRISEYRGDGQKTETSITDGQQALRPELVFVIHGRQLHGEFHVFLRSLGLQPLEWSEAKRRTKKTNPYTWEIVDLALREAGAIVALFTPDDEARLREDLWDPNENSAEKEFLSQPRQNVLFEAGSAHGRSPERTVLVRIGSHRPMSDLAGHHIIQLNNSPQSRQEVADALRIAGCPVDVSGTDWYRSGNFSLSDTMPRANLGTQKVRRDSGTLLLYKAQLKGCSDLRTAANIVASIHVFFGSDPQYMNPLNTVFLEKYPFDFKEQVSFNWEGARKRWALEDLVRDVETLNISD
jgi:predicted nucleotide-binding protein